MKDVRHDKGDLLFKNGDFLVEASEEQHIEDILHHDKGNFRNAPLLGIGLMRYLNSPHDTTTRTELGGRIKRQLEFDGFEVREASVDSNFNITIKTMNDNANTLY